MRVKVVGQNDTATALKGLLRRFKLVPSDTYYTFKVEIVEADVPEIVIDGVDCDLERQVVKYIAERAGRVVLQREGGNQDDASVKITVPKDDRKRYAVELGICRALSLANGAPEARWWRRRFF